MSLIFTYFNRYKRFDMDWDLGVAVHLADHFFTCFYHHFTKQTKVVVDKATGMKFFKQGGIFNNDKRRLFIEANSLWLIRFKLKKKPENVVQEAIPHKEVNQEPTEFLDDLTLDSWY